MRSQNSPILVTGSHRSGTTWIGKTLAYAAGTAYVHEPFNPDSDRGLCAAGFSGQYTFISTENEAHYRDALDDTMALRYRPLARLRNDPRLWSLGAAAVRWPRFTWYRLAGRRPVIKDPIALFSAPWLADTYNMSVIVMVRHPAAFAGSLKSKGWTTRFDFDQFLSQPLLMQQHLAPYEDEIRSLAEQRRRDRDVNPVDEAIVVWNIFYSVIDEYRSVHDDWTFLRHEDVSETPVESFQGLFARLGLAMTDRIEYRIRSDTASSEGAGTFDTQRNSRANITKWKRLLSESEIDRIREATTDVWTRFYSESDW